jgi:S1-C subfamily serine protease
MADFASRDYEGRQVAGRRPNWPLMLGVWTIVFLLFWTWLRPASYAPLHDPAAEPRPVVARGDLAEDEKATIDVFKEASPSVVFITTSDVTRDFFSLNPIEIRRGSGSGFIYDSQGHVVTNFHVVAEGRKWIVTLADGSPWEARIVGGAEDKDLAVLKIDAPPAQLKPIAVGASTDLQVGQKVFAIGNPFGLDQTLTTGIVSALGREIHSLSGRAIRDVIQTDAAINPGNSGGPLLDSAGRLIGVNTQIASPSGASAGIGFAIPVDTVNRVVPELIRHGRLTRPILGVIPLPEHYTRQLGLEGVLLQEVPEGSAADRAGLRGTVLTRDGRRLRQLGDIILKINDHPTPNHNALLDALDRYKVGDEVRVTYQRDDETRQTTVRLQAME